LFRAIATSEEIAAASFLSSMTVTRTSASGLAVVCSRKQRQRAVSLTIADAQPAHIPVQGIGGATVGPGTLWGRYSMNFGTNWYKQQHGCDRRNYVTLLDLCATLRLHPNPTKSSQTPFHGGNTGSNPVGDANNQKTWRPFPLRLPSRSHDGRTTDPRSRKRSFNYTNISVLLVRTRDSAF
jgi:hypothetical protein